MHDFPVQYQFRFLVMECLSLFSSKQFIIKQFILRFGFCDILKYKVSVSVTALVFCSVVNTFLDLIIPDITKTKSNNCLISAKIRPFYKFPREEHVHHHLEIIWDICWIEINNSGSPQKWNTLTVLHVLNKWFFFYYFLGKECDQRDGRRVWKNLFFQLQSFSCSTSVWWYQQILTWTWNRYCFLATQETIP